MLANVRAIAAFVLLALLTLPAMAQAGQAQTTDILVMLTVKPGIERDRIMTVLPDEIRATVRLYLAGKIRQWYSRSDERGVVFVLDCQSVDEARTIMGGLPLAKRGFVELQFTAMGPLTPLRLLLDDRAPGQ